VFGVGLAEELLQAVEDHVEAEEELGLVVVAGWAT
jgi:hypothetical protein